MDKRKEARKRWNPIAAKRGHKSTDVVATIRAGDLDGYLISKLVEDEYTGRTVLDLAVTDPRTWGYNRWLSRMSQVNITAAAERRLLKIGAITEPFEAPDWRRRKKQRLPQQTDNPHQEASPITSPPNLPELPPAKPRRPSARRIPPPQILQNFVIQG